MMEEMKKVDKKELVDDEVKEVTGGWWSVPTMNDSCPKCGGASMVDHSQPPYEAIPGRGTIVHWICEECGFKWKSVRK